MVRGAGAPRRAVAERGGRAARRHRLRPARVLRLDDRHAAHRRPRRRRRAVHQLPRHAAVLADAGVAAHRARRSTPWGCGRCRTSAPASPISSATSPIAPRRSPRCCATRATPRSAPASGTSRRWRTARPPGRSTSGRSVAGFDRFYGFLEGETDQFHPAAGVRQPPDRPARRPRGRLPPQRGPRRPAAADDRRQQGRAAGPPVLRLPAVRRHPCARTRRRRRTWRSTGARSTTAGTSSASGGTSASSSSA